MQMGQSDISSASDSVASQPSSHETSSHVFKESSFQSPGDNSPNDIWRQMKQGSDGGIGAGSIGGSGSHSGSSDIGKQGNTSEGSIDFAAHSDIYGSAGSHGATGGAGLEAARGDQGLKTAIGDQSARLGDLGGDSAGGKGVGMSSGLDSGAGTGSADGKGSQPQEQNFKLGDAGLDGGLPPTSERSDSGFERLSADDQKNAPVERLNEAVDQNHQNLISRIDSLGGDMPRVAFHGATSERAQAIDNYHGSGADDDSKGGSGTAHAEDRKIFVASPKTTSADAEGKLADMAISHEKADSYRSHDQPAYAFDVTHKNDKDFMTKRSQDTQTSVGEPFAAATNSYEAQMPLSDLKPLAKITPADASRVQPDHTAADYQDRIKALEALYRQSAIDSVISAVEKRNK